MRSVLVTVLLLALTACQGADPTPAGRPSPTVAAPAAPATSASATPGSPERQHALRTRLAEDPHSVREMTGRTRPRGEVLCGVDVLGQGPGEVYVWAECGDYRPGPDAESLSGSAEPAVVRAHRIVFPRQQHLDADIARLFPTEVAHEIRFHDVHPTPTADQLLDIARHDLGGPKCHGDQLGAEQPTLGGPAAGTYYVPVLITNNGPDCSLLADDLVLWAGSPARSRAALDVTGSGPVVLMPTGHTLSTYASLPTQPCRGARGGPPVPLALSDDTAVRPQVSVAGPGVPPDYGLCPRAGFTTSAGRRAALSR